MLEADNALIQHWAIPWCCFYPTWTFIHGGSIRQAHSPSFINNSSSLFLKSGYLKHLNFSNEHHHSTVIHCCVVGNKKFICQKVEFSFKTSQKKFHSVISKMFERSLVVIIRSFLGVFEIKGCFNPFSKVLLVDFFNATYLQQKDRLC